MRTVENGQFGCHGSCAGSIFSKVGASTKSGAVHSGEPYRSKNSGIDSPRWYCTLFCAMANLLFRWPNRRSQVAHIVSHYLGGLNHLADQDRHCWWGSLHQETAPPPRFVPHGPESWSWTNSFEPSLI
jgi:hypothetical protein